MDPNDEFDYGNTHDFTASGVEAEAKINMSIVNDLDTNLNFQQMRATGDVQSFSFETNFPEVVETDGFLKESTRNRMSLMSDDVTMKKIQFRHTDENYEEVANTMFGDLEDLEQLMEQVHEGDDRLKKLVMKSGTGAFVQENDVVRLHYLLGCEFMDELIDSTYASKCSSRFRVGAGEVLPILDRGVATMRVGEVSKFLGTCELGYGKQGVPLDGLMIPPSAQVVAQIELLDTRATKSLDSIIELSDMERKELGFQKLFEHAQEMKNDGNEQYQGEAFDKAKIKYNNALGCLKDMTPLTADQLESYLSLRCILFKNLCMVHYKMQEYKTAIKFAKAAAGVKVPQGLKAKANFWCAKCMYEVGKYEEGFDHIKTAQQILDSSGEVKELYAKFLAKRREISDQELAMCSRMLKSAKIDQSSVVVEEEKK